MTRTTWEYPNADGDVLFKTVRTDRDDGSKTFAQFYRETVTAGWQAKAPPWPRPVFGADRVEWLPDNSPILVVEGEKTAERAQELFGASLTVITWAGGSNAVKKTDWDILKRHRVAILPDLDQQPFPHTLPNGQPHPQAGQLMPFTMQPGTKAAMQIATLTGGALVDIPDAFIEAASWVKASGWDLADEMPDDFTFADIKSWVRKAFEALAPKEVEAVPLQADHLAAGVAVGDQSGGEALASGDVNGHHVDLVAVDDEIILPDFEETRGGDARPCFENARRLLAANQHKFKLRFDLFSNRPCYGDEPLEDHHILIIASEVQSAGVFASTATISEAVVAAAMLHAFHPVLDYLDGLKWDGIERLEMWLIDHAGIEDTPLHRAISKKWLIQAIARIRDPGCQADAMLILEGAQGLRKSSLLRALFGQAWFTDHLPDISSKDAQLQLLGMWCIEVAEMATLDRSTANKIKQFLTSRTDRFRPPFGRMAKDFPRACVFAGSVNPGGGYLKDPTGGRRFWPVECRGEIDVPAVLAQRDQLWAEADAAYRRGETWYLEDEVLSAAMADVQDDRREDDVWEAAVANHLRGKRVTTTPELLEHALGLYKRGEWTQGDNQRVGRILSAMQWQRKQERTGDGRAWKYYAPTVTNHERAQIARKERMRSGDSGDLMETE